MPINKRSNYKTRFGCKNIALSAILAMTLSACASVKLPKIDLIKLPDFRKESENLGEFPELADAPASPDEVRSDENWDQTVRAIISARDNFNAPVEPARAKTEAEIDSEIDRLTNAVNAYRADDPPQN